MKIRLWQDFLKCKVQRREKKGELQKQGEGEDGGAVVERMVVTTDSQMETELRDSQNTETWSILPPFQTLRGLLSLPLESMQFLVHSICFYSQIIRIPILYG